MRRLALLMFATVLACGEAAEPPGGILGLDANVDAGIAELDAAEADATPAPDAIVEEDARAADTGTAPDAEPADTGTAPDAEPADTGTAPDAEPRDATPTDATPIDAAPRDAAPADATMSDAADATRSDAADATTSDAADAGPAPDAAPPGDARPANTDAGGECTTTRECIAGAETCGRVTVGANGLIATRCGPPNPPPAASVGGACTADNQCADDLCVTGISNECSVICTDTRADCPAGFTCARYSYNPGPVLVGQCSRSCRDNDDCAGGNPGNVCSTHSYPTLQGPWTLALVCELPAGMGDVGAPCAARGGADCRSGICLTTSRFVGCLSDAMCNQGESCLCGNNMPPPCAGGAAAACISRSCTSPCDDDGDCQTSTFPSNTLTRCRPGITFSLPDARTATLSACGRQ